MACLPCEELLVVFLVLDGQLQRGFAFTDTAPSASCLRLVFTLCAQRAWPELGAAVTVAVP